MATNMNFKLSKDVKKNPGPTQYNTDHHEVIIIPFMQNHSSTMQLTSPISSENLMLSRLGEHGLQSILGFHQSCDQNKNRNHSMKKAKSLRYDR